MASVELCLCGDVMLGRGIDQLFPQHCGPELREPYLKDAREYLSLIEGPPERPVAPAYVWGEALELLSSPEARLINLETSVTTSDRFWPDKEIHYRVHPANVSVLTTARIDACALANNHVLDFSREGLVETVHALRQAGIQIAGAGRRLSEAQTPAEVRLRDGGTLFFFSAGTDDSGIPLEWAATDAGSGVHRLADLSDRAADALVGQVRAFKRHPEDLAVVSLHWGTNWGYEVRPEQVSFARRLIDGGVDLVHGHSSHHPRPLEVYRGRLILYGCGDFISDYEGIGGHEEYRDDLRPLYVARLDRRSGALEELRLHVFQSSQLRLRHASDVDSAWLADTLSSASRRFETEVVSAGDGTLLLRS